MNQSHWLLCVASVASRGMKTYGEGRIKLRNLQIFKKMLDKSSQRLSSEQPGESKSLDIVWNIAGVEKLRSEDLRLGSTWGHSIRVLNVSGGADLSPLCLVILKSV